MSERNLVFFSYRHGNDEQWLVAILRALQPFALADTLDLWSDRSIRVAERWHDKIQAALARTRVGVVLVSHDLFGSEYIRTHELPRLLADARQGLIDLVCVPVGPVVSQLCAGLSTYQFTHQLNKPLSARRGFRREQAVVEVAKFIDDAYRRRGVVPASEAKAAQFASRTVEPVLTAQGSATGASSGTKLRAELHGVPSLDERHFVPRIGEMEALKQQLLHGTSPATGVTAPGRARGLGVHGMGGMGKTVLAQALCHDEAVRDAFTDGIHWVTLGQAPDLLKLQNELLRALTPEAPPAESVAQGRKLLGERLAGQRVLLVIDDLWNAVHFLDAFDAVGTQGRVLLTTRDASALTRIGAPEVQLQVLELAQALTLLAQWVGVDATVLPESACEVARQCGNLPLALAVSGALVADGVSWETLVLELVQGRLQFLDHEYGSVFKTLGLSVDSLPAPERERYLELAVFPEDARVPVEAIERLWLHSGGLSQSDTEKLLGRLRRKALLTLQRQHGQCLVSFHDLQHDFIGLRAEAPQVLHGRLLDAYRATLGLLPDGAGWACMPLDEPYLWQRLAMHLAAAGRTDELAQALLDFDWIAARLASETRHQNSRQITDIAALQRDYEEFLKAAPDVGQVGRAMKTSAHVLAQHPQALAQQLFGRLGQYTQGPIHGLASMAQSHLAQHDAWLPTRAALAPPGATLQVCAGHEAGVGGALLISEGRRALSWSADGTLRLWDLEQPGAQPPVLTGHRYGVNGALVLPDGRRALSWSQDHTLRLWDLEQPAAEPRVLAGHESMVNGALVLPDERRALSWSQDHTLRLWDLEQPGAEPWVLAGHKNWVNGALVLPDGRRALSWSQDGTLRLWDLEQPLSDSQVLDGGKNLVNRALVLPNGRQALSWSSWDRTLLLWDLEQPLSEPQVLAGHENSINGALVLPDGRQALSWSWDGTLLLWDLVQLGTEPQVLARREARVNGAHVLPERQRVLSWSQDGTLQLWDLAQPLTPPRLLAGHEEAVEGVLVLPDGRRALSWSFDGTLRLWELEQPDAAPRVLGGHEKAVFGALALPDGWRALSWSGDRTLRLWDLKQPEVEPRLVTGHEKVVSGALMLPDGRQVLSWSKDRTLRLWDLEQPTVELQVLVGHEKPVNGALMLPDKQRALSWSHDCTLRLWDLAQPDAQPQVLAGHEKAVYGALALPERRQVLSWSADRTLRLWDLEQPDAQPRVLAGHGKAVYGALMLLEERQALSWSKDRTLRLWNLEQPDAQPQVLAGHENAVYGALVLPDGRRALSWSGDRTLRLWDLKQPDAPPRVLAGHCDSVYGAVVLPDGRQALSWSKDRTLRLWDLEQPDAESRALIGHEGKVYGALVLPDERRALSWSQDRTLRVWNLEQPAAEPHVLPGHKGAVLGAQLLPDERLALSWSADRTLRLWDFSTFRELACYFTDASVTTTVSGSSGRHIFIGDALGYVQVLCMHVE